MTCTPSRWSRVATASGQVALSSINIWISVR